MAISPLVLKKRIVSIEDLYPVVSGNSRNCEVDWNQYAGLINFIYSCKNGQRGEAISHLVFINNTLLETHLSLEEGFVICTSFRGKGLAPVYIPEGHFHFREKDVARKVGDGLDLDYELFRRVRDSPELHREFIN